MASKIVTAVLLLHLVMTAAVYFLGKRRGKIPGPEELLFCLLIPIFGPICGLEMVNSAAPDPELLRDLIMDREKAHKSYIAPDAEAPTAAPMEEAFLISTPQVRRRMMMKLLHDEPEENMEILMMARFNDDPETAHYATATLTEYQRKMEMSLQQSQMLLAKQPEDQEIRLDYIRQMETYIDSGLLEGHLLRRQRELLERELEKLPEEQLDLEQGCLKTRNLLALQRPADAVMAARRLITRFPGAEDPWLAMMRIYIDTQDLHGLESLRHELETAGVQWSYKGREKMEYFLKGTA